MRFIISETINKKLHDIIQNLIDSELNNIRKESEDWGLGEMYELNELDAIKKIEIDRVVSVSGIKVYINIYTDENDFDDFNNIRSEIQYRIEQWIPNIKLFINEIIEVN